MLLSFLAVCRDGVSIRRSPDPCIHHSRYGVIVPIPTALRELIHEYGFFHIVRRTSFDSAFSWFAYSRTFEVDWSSHELSDKLYLFEWATGDIFNLPERASTYTRNRVQEAVTLPVERARLFDGPYESLLSAQVKAMDYFSSLPGAPTAN